MLGISNAKWFVPIALNFKPQNKKSFTSSCPEIIEITTELQRTLSAISFPTFACLLGGKETGIIVCLSTDTKLETTLDEVHHQISAVLASLVPPQHWTMGVGTGSAELTDTIRRGLDEASRVAHSASSMDRSSRSYHRASDLGFRWLMQQLLNLKETRTYLHDQLEPFLGEPEYLDFIETYLQTNGSITEMSRELHLSRPSVYARLRRIEKVLGHQLTDADTMTSLHLAVTLYRLGVRDSDE